MSYCDYCMSWRGHKATCPAATGDVQTEITDWSIEAYRDFLAAKANIAKDIGFAPEVSEINPWLKPHQQAVVRWAVAGGRRAIFASFGLGKTVIQLEVLRLICQREGGRSLIVAPLGVRQEFRRDAEKLGLEIKFIRSVDEAGETGLYITNYETVRDGKIDPKDFTATSLDEASVLRGFGGSKTFREFMRVFEGVKYRFVATATPDPNEYIELLAYAAYLGIMDVSGAKTRYFKRDSTKADKLTIHPHKEKEFWVWVASWALFLRQPSDLGFDDEGYSLPEMEVITHEIEVDHTGATPERDGQGRMFREALHGVVDAAKEKRETLSRRVAKIMEILDDDDRRKRKEAGLLQVLLRKESGSTAPKTEGSEPTELPSKAGNIQDAKSEMARSESGSGKRVTEVSCGQKQGSNQSAKQGLVQGEYGKGPSPNETEEACRIRTDADSIRSDAGRSKRELCDLRSADESSESGSLPQDGSGPGAALHEVQFGAGDVRRQHGCPETSRDLLDQVVIWCDLNQEQRAIEKELTDRGISFSSLDGSQSIEHREMLLEDWKERRTKVFLTKPTMYGAGVNLQQANRMIFAGIGFKFQDFVQGIHRIFRFLQTRKVEIHIIYAESERRICEVLMEKWARHKERSRIMSEMIRQYGLSQAAMIESLKRSLGVERIEVTGPNYMIANNDCVEETESMPESSVDLVLTSIPFSTQYEYSPSFNDFGHTDNNEHFWQQMGFIIHRLLKVLKPGRLAAIHVKDRIIPGGVSGLGFQTVYPFHADAIRHFTKHGFAFMGMKTIVTDVVRENNQTYRLGWTEQCKDGSKMGYGMPEYLLLFRKPPTDSSNGYADEPVVKSKEEYSRGRWQMDAHGFARSSGDRLLTPEDFKGLTHAEIFQLFKKRSLSDVYSFENHVALAEGLEAAGILPVTFMLLQPQSWNPEVWTDITRMRTLNGAQAAKGKEAHLCPMQFDICDRVITQNSMPGETVFDPFGGLMTVPYCAIKLGRKAIASELSTPYFIDGKAYVREAAEFASMPTLFDLIAQEDAKEDAA